MPQNFTGTYATTQVLNNPTTQNPATVQSIGSLGVGIQLASGGLVTNGASGSASGLVVGSQTGVSINGAAGTVANYGTVQSTGVTAGVGVYLGQGGVLTNQA